MVDIQSPFTFNLKEFIIDEIALEGLEGIGIASLWKRLEVRTSSPISEKMQEKWWNFIINCKSISIYQQPVPVKCINIVDRFSIVNEETGYLSDPDFYLDGDFEYKPIDGENGSCVHYDTRKLITKAIKELPYKTILAKCGDYLVLVASLEERWKALAPHLPMSYLAHVPQLNYCLLELIGRARENGQMTSGTTNLTKMIKEAKILFYYRKSLQDLGLIKVSYITQFKSGKAVKGLLLRLKRFHKAIILTVPKTGMIKELVDYLKERPNYCELAENVIKQRLMTPMQYKKFQKKANMFQFADKLVPIGETTNSTGQRKLYRKRYMSLIAHSDDESSQSEDEEVTPLKCQYKVGVNLVRQAYERFLEAGKNGLTQNELSQLLGVEFYVCRSICRIFKKKNIVREFFEYNGKQRLGRFIAIAATSKMDSTLAEEKEKLQKYLDEGKNTTVKRKASTESEPLSQIKKRKLDNNDVNPTDPVLENITEINEIFENGVKKQRFKPVMSLRHIKFASGVVKVLNERTFVGGYQTLSNLVAKEVDEPPMDTKAMKIFLQNMLSEGHIKVYKMKLPRLQQQYSIVISAPHIQKTDPLLRAKYKEEEIRALCNKKITQQKLSNERSLSVYAFPRYVKVKKLHESLMKIVYFNDVKSEPWYLQRGFFLMDSLIPQLTLGVALGHISSEGVIDIAKFAIDDSMYDKKISDVPKELQIALINSSNLVSSLRNSLRILATFGLLQFVAEIPRASRISDNNLTVNTYYLNKTAKIIDTTGTWPRVNATTQNVEKEFHFESFEDVVYFWNTVYNYSLNTTINFPERKKSVLVRAPIRTKEQVANFDVGLRFGDGLGPCGYDSSYYMELQRLWRAYCVRSTSKQAKETKKVQIPKFKRPKKIKIVKKNHAKQVQVKTPKPPGVVEDINPVIKLKKNKVFDGVVWTLEDDRFLMLCKTALIVVSPLSQPGSLQVRNLVAKDILTINDPKKTFKICHNRAAIIESNSTLIHERNWLLNELRRNDDVLSKYDGLLKKIRTIYPTNMTKCINEARVPMMELVWILYHLLKNIARTQEIPCVAMDYDDFNQKFNLVPSSANRRLNVYRTPHDKTVLSTLKEAVMLTVMLSFNYEMKEDDSALVYNYFQQFPELVLRLAIESMRKCGAIAAREKILNSQMHAVDLHDITQCSYRISVLYQRKWTSRLMSDFADSVADCLNQNESEHPIKAGSATNCFCFELHSSGALELVALTVPVITGSSGSIMQDDQLNVFDIETNYKLKSGKIGWKNKSNVAPLGKLYQDIQVETALENLLRRYVIYDTDTIINPKENEIVSYLLQKDEKGATLDELEKYFKYDRESLTKSITELESTSAIKRVGFYENVVVHIKFAEKWAMKVAKGSILPVPWLTLDSEVRSEIFFQWAGVVLNKVFENPGCSIAYLSESCEFITARAVQDICEVLQKWDCVTLHCLRLEEPDLFSDDDNLVTEMSDYNEYESPKHIVALPILDCMTKFSYLRGMVLDK